MFTHYTGCKFDGECKSKKIMKSRRNGEGSRDSFRVYCSFGSTCNQQVPNAPKCETPTVETTTP